MFDTPLECLLTSTHYLLLRRILELGQRLERVLRTTRQHHSVAGDLQAAEWHDDQMLAHAEEAAHRQHGEQNLIARLDEEIVHVADLLVGVVDDGAADDLRRAISRRQFLDIDSLDNRLRRACAQTGPANRTVLTIAAP